MKKYIALILAVALVISIAACNNNESNIAPNESSESTATAEDGLSNEDADTESLAPDFPSQSTDQIERLGFSGGNIGAGGLVCGGDDGYIYYRSESDGWRLYRARPDGSEKTKVSDRIGTRINVLDGWVYFLDYSEGFPIYRTRTDGTEEAKLVDGYCDKLYVSENGMYFDMRDENNASHIYRSDLDGGNIELLFPDASLMYYYKGKIYLGAGQLGVYDIETGEEIILDNSSVHNVSVDETGIYYWVYDENEFRHMDLDGSNRSVIMRGGDFFNYTDGYLYFMGISENANGPCHVINRLSVETGEIVTLYEALNELFDDHGNLIGVTLKQFNEGIFDSDIFEINSQGEMVLKGGGSMFAESVGYVYVAGEHLYMRASLREAILQNGKFECIAQLDGGMTVWD
jgi:hypothetical protein